MAAATSLLLHPLVWVTLLVAVRSGAATAWWGRGLGQTSAPASALVDYAAAHPGAADAGRLAYLALPFVAAIALRLAEPGDLGLALPPSLASWLLATAMAIATAVVVLAVSGSLVPTLLAPPAPRPLDGRTAGALALEAAALEAHWAFFRAAVLAVGLSDTGSAVFIALGLLALEAWSDPHRRAALGDPLRAHGFAVHGCVAIMSGLVFLATGSTPVCLAAHLVVRAGLWSWGIGETPRPLAGLRPRAGEPTAVEPTVV